MIQEALRFAVAAHRGQIDKAGKPYILHPLRLMRRAQTEAEQCLALLHDVLEDSRATYEHLVFYFTPEIMEVLRLLTRRPNQTYGDYIQHIKQNPLATRIKILDLEDNMDVRRLKDIGEEEIRRLKKYHKSWKMLKGEVNDSTK